MSDHRQCHLTHGLRQSRQLDGAGAVFLGNRGADAEPKRRTRLISLTRRERHSAAAVPIRPFPMATSEPTPVRS